MIYCPQCGNPNFDDANYCDTCGEPLISAEEYAKMRNAAEMRQLLEVQRQQQEAAAYNKAYRKAQKDAKKAVKAQQGAAGQVSVGGADGCATGAPDATGTVDGQAAHAAASVATASGASASAADAVGAAAAGAPGSAGVPGAGAAAAGAPGSAAEPVTFPVYKHGCLAQAWDDITESEGWAKRILLLGLVNLVPVLNFFVQGFAMQWARQLPIDKVEGMPAKIFRDGAFVQGFYGFVITLVVGVVSAIVAGVFGFVPVLGALVGVAASLLLSMFRVLATMRVAIAQNLAPGFDVKALWGAVFTNRFGKLFCATLLPGIIVGAATVFICGSALVVFGLNSLTLLFENIQYAHQMEQMAQMNPMMQMFGYSNPWPAVVSQAMGLVPLFFVMGLIAMFLSALGTVLTMRATAHYVTRYHHDWAALAEGQPTA